MLVSTLVAAIVAFSPATRSGPSILIPIDGPDDMPRQATGFVGVPTSNDFRPGLPELSAVANVRVNDPSQLSAPGADITPAVAVNGNQVMIVWRVVGTLVTQRLRAAISEDGGNTFTDVGWLPGLPGGWRWGVDPCVEVDPFDGTFLIAAQVIDPGIAATGIGIVTAHIGGGVVTWGTSSIAHATGYVGAYFADQLHMKFDPTNFSWHIVFHDGYVTPQALIHRYSVDHGATWFAPDTISSDLGGFVGISPRVAYVGYRGPIVLHTSTPDGSWWSPFSVKSSAFFWPSFQPTVPLSTFRFEPASFPGTVGDLLSAPTIAVDRTPFLYSSRIYAAWVQSASLSPWPTPPGDELPEAEPNGTPATANPLGTSSGHVTGTISSNSDADVFSVALPSHRHLVLVPEGIQSTGVNANLGVQMIAPDGVHTLGFTSFSPSDAGIARMLFTAPRASTYSLRVTGFNAGQYQLKLSYSDDAAYPAQDRRDLMTSFSTDLGATWSSPSLVPVSGPGFDAGLVDVVVSNDGRPYLFWVDFSAADPDGAIAVLKTTRSNDGGLTWETPRTLSTAPSDWQPVTASAGSSAKFGWRLDAATTPIPLGEAPEPAPSNGPARTEAATPAEDMHVTWVDARDGEGNIYAAHFPSAFEVLFRQTDTTAVPGQWLGLRMVLQNRNTVFPDLVTPSFLACQRNWPSVFAPFSIDPGRRSPGIRSSSRCPTLRRPGRCSIRARIGSGQRVMGSTLSSTFNRRSPWIPASCPRSRSKRRARIRRRIERRSDSPFRPRPMCRSRSSTLRERA